MTESALAISAFPAAASASNGDVGLFTQGSTGPGTGITRKVSLAQMLAGGAFTATNTSTLRTLADRAADWVNVRDFGAVLNGTTNDTAAINAARTATPANGTVRVPAGGWFNNTTPVGGPSTPILWQMTGNTFTTGTTPVSGIGTDTVESFVVGSKYFGRIASVANMSPVFRVDQTISHSGGTSGFVMSAAKFNTTVTGNTANFGYGVTSVTHSVSSGGGNTVAVAGYAYKDANGDIAFGGNFLATDTTGNASSVSGAIVGTEFDIVASGGLDDGGASNHLIPAGSGIRVGLDVVGYRTTGGSTVAEIGYLVRAGAYTPKDLTSGAWPSTAQYAKRVFTAIGAVSIAAYDASLATITGTGNAFRMAPDQTFAFDGLTNSRTLAYVTADTALEYKKSGATLWSVSDAGVMSASALATGGTTARTLAAIFADQNNVKSQGAVGDGTTVDLAALTGTTMPAYIPKGVFNTAAAFGFLNPSGGIRRWFAGSGGGNILTSEGPQAGNIMFVKAAPSYPGPGTSITNMFNGSMQNHLGFQTYIAGTATLGQPTTGYVVNPAVASILGAVYNTSGWNNSTSTASGRTGMHGMFFNLQQGGNGDLIGFGVNGVITGVRAGATYFLGSPVVGVINGDIKAGVDNCYLDPAEIFCRDQGFQSAAFGIVRNMQRDATVASGKVSQDWPWAGIFLQSTGATAIDAFFAMTGPAAIGIDFACVSGGFKDTSGAATNAAITMRAGMRTYGNATNPGSGAGGTSQIPSYTTPGTEWLSYETATGWGFVVGSASVFSANATAVTASKNLIRKAATADQSADVYVATAAGSRTIPDGCSWEALTPAATIATFTTTMPAAPIDKQEVWISTTQTITTWTLSANTGQAINGAPTTLAANTSVMFRYNLATTAWFRMV